MGNYLSFSYGYIGYIEETDELCWHYDLNKIRDESLPIPNSKLAEANNFKDWLESKKWMTENIE